MNESIDELIPWYVNGTLGADDRERVEAYLKQHPEATAELNWYRSLSQRIQDNAPVVPATLGLDKVMARIHRDRPTLSQRIAAFIGSFAMRPSYALAGLAIIALQGGVILKMLDTSHDESTEMRALRASVTNDGPMLKINFAPDAKEADIRHLLTSVQGRLAGG